MREENIHLSLPVNAAYVSAARLTASSIANRMTFDIDEIEDIKAAVSEACTFVIKHSPPNGPKDFSLEFTMGAGELSIAIETQASLPIKNPEGEMGLVMIRALMDSVGLDQGDPQKFTINMVKKHKAISFD